jgi:hypothetical protein
MLEQIKRLFPSVYEKYLLEKLHHYSHFHRIHNRRLKEIRKRGSARVLFLLSNLAIWRSEDICKLLMEDSRFDVRLVICPFADLADIQKKNNTEELIAYCQRLQWPYILKSEADRNLIESLDPDIIFYPQMYTELYRNELDCEKNLDRLLVYVPYGICTVSGDWQYNSRFSNNTWKFFVQTSLHRDYARHHSFIKGKNMEVVGDSHGSAFLREPETDPWKKQDKPKKRIIWAPHFSINEGGHLNRASFLWLHELMVELSREYRDDVQFVFKPHPWLLTELYKRPEWGEKKANEYYEFWRTGENTQLETGAFIDLFNTSDAMIHDCGSFTAEYHYTGKPVLFASKDFPAIYQGLDSFGARCMDLHYHAQNADDIRSFIRHTVLEGDDPMKQDRDKFRKQYLLPPEGFSFGNNVYRSLTESLFPR